MTDIGLTRPKAFEMLALLFGACWLAGLGLGLLFDRIEKRRRNYRVEKTDL